MRKTRTDKRQAGQGLIEYVILVALIALASMVATESLGKKVKSKLTEIRNNFDSRVHVNGGDKTGDAVGGAVGSAVEHVVHGILN